MSDAIRQIRARARRKAAGLVRLEFWVPATHREQVKAAVAAALAAEEQVDVAPATTGTPEVPVVQRRQRLMTDIDGLLD